MYDKSWMNETRYVTNVNMLYYDSYPDKKFIKIKWSIQIITALIAYLIGGVRVNNTKCVTIKDAFIGMELITYLIFSLLLCFFNKYINDIRDISD